MRPFLVNTEVGIPTGSQRLTKGKKMGTKADRQRAEEEANAIILAEQNESTLGDENTDVEETKKPDPQPDIRTPEPDKEPDLNSEQTWEAKYKVLQGKYNAEVPKMRDEIQSLKQQLDRAPLDAAEHQQQISQLTQQIETLTGQLEAKNQPDGDDIDALISEEYGPELSAHIRKAIEKHTSKPVQTGNDVSDLKKTVENIQRANEQTQHQAKMTSLEAMLKADGIDFSQMDSDPLFHEWLAGEEGQSGQARQSFLEHHFASGDLKRAAAFYIAFKAQERSSFDKNPLGNHVDAAQRHSAPDSGTEPETWSATDIERFYADVRKGRLTQAEINKYEQSLARAMQEGRVTG